MEKCCNHVLTFLTASCPFSTYCNAGINVKTESGGGGGGGGTGKGAAFEFFGNFLLQFPTLGTGK